MPEKNKNKYLRQAMQEAYQKKRAEIQRLPDAPPPPASVRTLHRRSAPLRWAAAAVIALAIGVGCAAPAAAWAKVIETVKVQVSAVRLQCEELFFGPAEPAPNLHTVYTLSTPPEAYLENSCDTTRYSAHTMWRKAPGHYLYLSQQCFGVEADAMITGGADFYLNATVTDRSLYTKVGYAAGGFSLYQWQTEEYSFMLLMIGPDAETVDLSALAETLIPRASVVP